MAKIVFYTHSRGASLNDFEYYKQDIDALKALGHEVVVCTAVWEIPIRFDAIFVWWWTHALLPVLLCRVLKRPSIVTGTFNFRYPEEFQGKDYFKRPYWQRFLIKSAAKNSSLNLFVSQLELQQCAEYFGLRNVGYMPHCVDDDYLQGPSNERKNVLFNISWSGKQNLIRKGVPELLEAVRILKDRGQFLQLYLAGMEGDGRPYLLETIRRLGLEDRVQYLGGLSREEKIRRLRECEIYVQPSHYEGFGLAILESMGSGACAIVRDVGAVKEVVGDCGLYVPSPSPTDLADLIQRVLNDRELRHRIQRSGAERARSLFTFRKKLERLAEFLRGLGIADTETCSSSSVAAPLASIREKESLL